jgi:uncharacterized protein YkwD
MSSPSLRLMLRICWIFAPIVMLLVIPFAAAAPARAAEAQTQFRVVLPLILMSQPTLSSTAESQVVALTNDLRQQHGCAPLVVSPALSVAAQQHSQEMADNNYFSHIDLSGHNPSWRALLAGSAGSAGAENIAAGYTTAEEVVMAWYNETPPNDGHRQNLLNCGLTEVGIGYAVNPGSKYRSYWSQDFGRS